MTILLGVLTFLLGTASLFAVGLLIAGGGVVAAGAERELRAVVRRLGGPVIATVGGRGAVDESERLTVSEEQLDVGKRAGSWIWNTAVIATSPRPPAASA